MGEPSAKVRFLTNQSLKEWLNHETYLHHVINRLPLQNDTLLVLVGGWTGRQRSNSVHLFDLQQSEWIVLTENMNGKERVQPPMGKDEEKKN